VCAKNVVPAALSAHNRGPWHESHGSAWPRPGQLPEQSGEIEASGLFEVTHVRHFDWERVYDAEGYIELLDTFSGHIAMAGWQRERLYGEIRRRLALRPDRTLRRHWEAVLHVARRLDRRPGGGAGAWEPDKSWAR
jgi:hypothetical protein